MKHLWILFIAVFVAVSCSDTASQSKSEIRERIKKQEKKISNLTKKPIAATKVIEKKRELIETLLSYYHDYPEDPYAATCLAKVHMAYAGMGETNAASAYADTLIDKYPDFEDRVQIIESQIMTYEIEIQPRDVNKIREYLKLWLKENKDAPKEKIEEMEYHLKHVDVPLMDRIKLNLEALD